MDLFDQNGHLTDEAIRAAIQQTLDEMGRLEVSEHLSFCDQCLLRYTQQLTDDTLMAPQTPVAPPVLSRIRQKTVRIFFNKYVAVAAAASFALVFWGTGVFQSMVPLRSTQAQTPTTVQTQTARKGETVTERSNAWLRSISGALNDALGQIAGPKLIKSTKQE